MNRLDDYGRSMKRHEVKSLRRLEAKQRQDARDKLGDIGQLTKLVHEGHGHCKEAKRLNDRIREDVGK